MWVDIYGDNTGLYCIVGHSHHVHQQWVSAFVFHLWVASCLDPSIYQKCFSIWWPSGLFCHIIGMRSPWQGRILCQVHRILCNPTCILVLGVQCFCCFCCRQAWGCWLCLLTALTVLDPKPMALRLYAMAMWVLHVSIILAAVALRSRASNFLTSSLSVRVWTRQNWTFHCFSSSVGKLHLLARALRWSTSSSGVSPGLIYTSFNWYIQHLCNTVWSILDSKWSRKDFALFLIAAMSFVVMLAGVHWFHFWQWVVPREFSIYCRWAPLLSGVAWRWTQLSIDSWKSLNSSYWTDVVLSKWLFLSWWLVDLASATWGLLLELQGVSCSTSRLILLGHDCRVTRRVQTHSADSQFR